MVALLPATPMPTGTCSCDSGVLPCAGAQAVEGEGTCMGSVAAPHAGPASISSLSLPLLHASAAPSARMMGHELAGGVLFRVRAAAGGVAHQKSTKKQKSLVWWRTGVLVSRMLYA
jgi:hypothetical protein